jgi:SRSO17 transposase
VLGLTRLPPWFEEEFARFESVFSDSRNVESFTALVSAVILAKTQWTVSELFREILRPDGDAKSDRTYRYFLGKANWSATALAQIPDSST